MFKKIFSYLSTLILFGLIGASNFHTDRPDSSSRFHSQGGKHISRRLYQSAVRRGTAAWKA